MKSLLHHENRDPSERFSRSHTLFVPPPTTVDVIFWGFRVHFHYQQFLLLLLEVVSLLLSPLLRGTWKEHLSPPKLIHRQLRRKGFPWRGPRPERP